MTSLDSAISHLTTTCKRTTPAENCFTTPPSMACLRFGVSDQPTHFKNELLRDMADIWKVTHQFTVANVPHSNGTVEQFMRLIILAPRPLLLEQNLAPSDWVKTLPLIIYGLNTAVRPRTGYSPLSQLRSEAGVPCGVALSAARWNCTAWNPSPSSDYMHCLRRHAQQ